MWVRPDRWSGTTLLSLYNPAKRSLFRVHQSVEDLELLDGSSEFTVDNAFRPSLREKKMIFLAAASGRNGTTVYLNGGFAKHSADFLIPATAFDGRIIVGDAPLQPDSFRGAIAGLALYGAALDAAQVLRHYQTWIKDGRPTVEPNDSAVAIYLFDEKSGRTIHDSTGRAPDLGIPDQYEVIDKIFLEPFWTEFDFSEGYWRGNLKNVVGFIPVGFFFYAYFMIARPIRRPVLVTVAAGCLISVAIEVLQGFLPMRDSGTTDIITNTLGTWIGVAVYRHRSTQKLRKLFAQN